MGYGATYSEALSLQFEKYFGYINPSNMYSATIEVALAKGIYAYQSGVKFNNSAILNCGFATPVDSVMAVKEFVYDKGIVSLGELAKAPGKISESAGACVRVERFVEQSERRRTERVY